MALSLRHPAVGHALILAGFIVSVGVVRTVYVEPRAREVKTLHATEVRLRTELTDLEVYLLRFAAIPSSPD